MRDNRVRAAGRGNQKYEVIFPVHVSVESLRQPVGVILIIYRTFSRPLAFPEEVCCGVERDTVRQFIVDLFRPCFRREPDKLLSGRVRDNLLPVLFGVSYMQLGVAGTIWAIFAEDLPPVGF